MSNTIAREHVMNTSGTYLTPDEIAEELKLSTMTVYRIIKRGELDAVRVGKAYRVPVSAFRRYLNNNRVSMEQG